jgi:hypothetical protein
VSDSGSPVTVPDRRPEADDRVEDAARRRDREDARAEGRLARERAGLELARGVAPVSGRGVAVVAGFAGDGVDDAVAARLVDLQSALQPSPDAGRPKPIWPRISPVGFPTVWTFT